MTHDALTTAPDTTPETVTASTPAMSVSEPSAPSMPGDEAEVLQLAIPDLAEPPSGPAKFRLDRATRLRGLAHVAEIRALLNRRAAIVGEQPANDRVPGRAA